MVGHSRGARRRTRTASALAIAAMVLALAACDGSPRGDVDDTTRPADPLDPRVVAESATTSVDPSWLCDPGGDADAPEHSGEPGVLSPGSVQAEGNHVTVTGAFRLGEDSEYGGFIPDAEIVPSHPENRGAPAQGYEGQLGVEGAPAPPMVARERVEVPGEGAAPSSATAQLTLGTCDDAPLPDGQYLLSLSGGGVDGPGRDEDGWSSSQDVLLDVVGGELRAVPGAVTAPEGEIPADLSPLGCRAPLKAVGDGDGLNVAVSEQETSVSTLFSEEADGVAVDAQVTVTAKDLGTRALLQGVVLTSPDSGTVVAGARNAPAVGLQWIDEDGVSTAESAWTTRLTCTHAPLNAGSYEAHGFAVTVDQEGATHIVLSDPWTVDVVEGDAAA
ncbi:hypothetical protein [Brachybacterium sp. FME24]|uniref:hypothetical protein n=1 Tax=Brachybacterium sp. FME24 TaxID=2742605 RepID=UPI001867E0AA|nr:hypothetical protein [Brachybacterium sp. FME24]